MGDDIRDEICRVMRVLYEKGLVSALGGNVSAREPGADEFWITPSGVHKGRVKPEDLIKVDLNLNRIEGRGKPSIETPFHAAVYRVRPDVNAVVHAHNPLTVGFALAYGELKPVTVEEAVIAGKPCVVPYAPPGSEDLARLVAKAASSGARVLILQHHGVVALGRNLTEAEAIVEVLEESALVRLACLLAGKAVPALPEKISIGKG